MTTQIRDTSPSPPPAADPERHGLRYPAAYRRECG
jgi:hypothetical protein